MFNFCYKSIERGLSVQILNVESASGVSERSYSCRRQIGYLFLSGSSE